MMMFVLEKNGSEMNLEAAHNLKVVENVSLTSVNCGKERSTITQELRMFFSFNLYNTDMSYAYLYNLCSSMIGSPR